VGLIVVRPRRGLLRLLPDELRLIRLAADKTLPRGIRIRLALLLAYLAIPVDLIPDFVPVLGYADDAIIVTAVLRSVVRRGGSTRSEPTGRVPTTGSLLWRGSPASTGLQQKRRTLLTGRPMRGYERPR
jgi:uncharacterized membrane protein YkvA (DUF1232 family)